MNEEMSKDTTKNDLSFFAKTDTQKEQSLYGSTKDKIVFGLIGAAIGAILSSVYSNWFFIFLAFAAYIHIMLAIPAFFSGILLYSFFGYLVNLFSRRLFNLAEDGFKSIMVGFIISSIIFGLGTLIVFFTVSINY